MSPKGQREVLEQLAEYDRGNIDVPIKEEEAPEIQLALLELAGVRQDVPDVEPLCENVDVQPEDNTETAGESGGSVSGSIMSRKFYTSTSNRIRMGTQKPPPIDKLRDNEDLKVRFNGRRTAYEEYRSLEGKSVILDKGFDANLLTHGLISRMIREHGWTRFCMHNAEDSNWELLREFYANINSTAGTSWVRGKTVRIDAGSLNRFLGTSEQQGVLTYEKINTNSAPNRDKDLVMRIAWSMCDGPPRFYGLAPTFHETQIKVELKPSFDFYFAKVKPVTHTHRVSGITLFGLSEILLGKVVNIGELINKTLTRRTRGMFTHPNLIRRLCDDAGVNFSEFVEDKHISIGGPIPLLPRSNAEEYRYELVPLSAEQQPEQQPEGDQSRAPTPQFRVRRQPQPRGRKRQRRGEEPTINKGEIPEPSELRTENFDAPTPASAPSQDTQFTDISQTVLTLQREQATQLKNTLDMMERQMTAVNEVRLKEKEMELQARREELREADERRIKAEQERERKAQEFQLQMTAIIMGRVPIETLLGSISGQPSQVSQQPPATTPPPQDQSGPSQPSASSNPQNPNPPPPPASGI